MGELLLAVSLRCEPREVVAVAETDALVVAAVEDAVRGGRGTSFEKEAAIVVHCEPLELDEQQYDSQFKDSHLRRLSQRERLKNQRFENAKE